MGKLKNVRKISRGRHGFYTRFFDDLEEEEIKELGDDIDKELQALRVTARRLLEAASSGDELSLGEEMKLLEAFGKQCVAVAALVRTRKLIGSIAGETQDAVRRALDISGDDWEAFRDAGPK